MDNQLNELMNEGFSMDKGIITETLVTQCYANGLMTNVVLQQMLELKQMIAGKPVDHAEIQAEVTSICDQIAEQATKQKNDWIARYTK